MLQSFVMQAIWGGDDNLAGLSHGPQNCLHIVRGNKIAKHATGGNDK